MSASGARSRWFPLGALSIALHLGGAAALVWIVGPKARFVQPLGEAETLNVRMMDERGDSSGAKAETQPLTPDARGAVPIAESRSDASPAASSGRTVSTGDSLHAYLFAIRSRIQSRLEYPVELQRRRIQGRVQLELVVEPSGRARSIRVVQGSGFDRLDRLALSAAQNAGPFEPFSEKLGPATLLLPIDFVIR